MGRKSSVNWLAVIIVWSVILSLGAAIVFKFILKPGRHKELESLTSSRSQYDHEITINVDSFSGYCIVRSDIFQDELKTARIRLNLRDDNAGYSQRIRDLYRGKCQFAVFTVDSLITSSVEYGEWPGTIILAIDESNGADAVVAYKVSVPNLSGLDDPGAKMVLTPDSPSEFMARIVTAHFSLKGLPRNYIESAEGSTKVYEKFVRANHEDKKAYIMWEPDVSKALEEQGSHILLDSSKIKGYIFDVLVVQREFLAEHPRIAEKVVEVYLRAAYAYRNEMVKLVLRDAGLTGGKLTPEQAEKIVKGVLWKNSVENYAHFGLLDRMATKGLDHIEDIIQKITGVLVNTGAIDEDPFQGNYNKLFYDKILRKLRESNFHPGRKVNLLAQEMGTLDTEGVRGTAVLPSLSDAEWSQLVPVGRMKINPISFGRGKATIGIQSQRDLKELTDKLRSWPSYYLIVVGHARQEGDKELNRQLARDRAEAVKDYLINQCGINSNRIMAKAAKLFKRGGGGQSVSFVLGQMPY